MNNGNFKYILCTKMFLNADIKEVNEACFIFWVHLTLSLQYPLLFSRGEDEYLKDVQYNDVSYVPTIKRQMVTIK